MNAYELSRITMRLGTFSLLAADMAFERGLVYALVGENGAGKSTFMDTLALVHTNWSGDLTFLGQRISPATPAALVEQRRRIGYLQQTPYLFNMSVYSNVAYGLALRGCDKEEIRNRVQGELEHLELSHLVDRHAHHLSGGEAQRVALARVLVLRPAVLLLDEPTANVDRHQVDAIEARLRDLHSQGNTTIILSTHSQAQAHRMAGQILALHDGHVRSMAYENVYHGTLTMGSERTRIITFDPGWSLRATQGDPGPVTVAVDSDAVLLSRAPVDSTALNCLRGTIHGLVRHRDQVRVEVHVGRPLSATVSYESMHKLNLKPGDTIWATIKASAIHVL